MLVYEYKLSGSKKQYAAIEEAIRVVQFIRNKSLRLWMDNPGTSKNDLQTNCAVLAKEYPFARKLNSQARQASADRAWFAISRFYDNCKSKKPGKKGYPQFQHSNRSVEYKTTGWKLDGRHITFTDGCGIGRLKLVGNKNQQVEEFPLNQIKRVRIVKRADGYYCQFCVDAERTVEHIPTGKQVGYEDLQIRNMVRNRKLAKSIHDAGWGTFMRWLQYYGHMHDIPIIAVPSQYTSQKCSACGTLVKKSLSVRTHICTSCGVVLDRDHNAALNILDKALGTVGHTGTSKSASLQNASGDLTSTASPKRKSSKSSR
jgi:transposase